jgi:hypothetical protein
LVLTATSGPDAGFDIMHGDLVTTTHRLPEGIWWGWDASNATLPTWTRTAHLLDVLLE